MDTEGQKFTRNDALRGAYFMERKALSKRTRFEIFKRDRFRCTYCGATPVDRPMHVDHVKPVVEGGTDAPENLVTACGDCNLGKGGVPLEKKRHPVGRLTEADLDHAEQIREYLAVQRDVSEAREGLKDYLLQEWERRLGPPPKALRSRVVPIVTEFGSERLMEAFDIIEERGPRNGTDQLRYLHGILKRWRGGEPTPPGPTPSPPKSVVQEPAAVVRAREAVSRTINLIGAAPERWPTSADRLGAVMIAFAEAAGASSTEISEQFGTMANINTNDPEEVHGVRLVWKSNGDKVTPVVEAVPGYNPFREAFRELAEEFEYRLGYELHLHREAVRLGEPGKNLVPAVQDAMDTYARVSDWLEAYGVSVRDDDGGL